MNSYLNIRINGKNLEKKEDIENAILKFDEDLKENPDDEATIVMVDNCRKIRIIIQDRQTE